MSQNISRKQEHVEIASSSNVEPGTGAGWEDIHFVHQSLPEIDRDEVNPSADFCGRTLNYPLVISALTGGYPGALEINRTLGRLAEHFGIVMELGSQRPMLEFPELVKTYAVAREVAPHAFLVANVGAGQLIAQKNSPPLTTGQIKKLVSAIGADALAIHLNFLQESVMPEGDRRARGCTDAIRRVSAELPVPVIVKETGAGISAAQALALKSCGVAALDTGGAGGTSMAFIESVRAASHGDTFFQQLGRTFGGWGIPTAVSIVEAGVSGLPLIASGGIRTGLDAAKALALGAGLAGMARPILGRVRAGGFDGALEYLHEFLEELSITMFLAGAARIGELRKKPLVITGKTAGWLGLLGYDLARLSKERR